MSSFQTDCLLSPSQAVEVDRLLLDIERSVIQSHDADPGLLSGKAGKVLFHGYSWLAKHEALHLQQIETLLDEILVDLTQKKVPGYFSVGLTGIGWAIQHLRNKGVLSEEWDDFLADLDPYVDLDWERHLKAAYPDLLHGYLGNASYYFESQNRRSVSTQLTRIVHQLISEQTEVYDLPTWTENKLWGRNKGKQVINLGLAHGLPSILGFAAQAYKNGITPELCTTLMEDAMKGLLGMEKRGGRSFFPSEVLVEDLPKLLAGEHFLDTRLGWCHGDMGVACAMYQAGIVLQRAEWQQKAIALMVNAAEREPAQSGLGDVGFCHGVASTVHIFLRFYQWTQQEVFKEAAWNWLARLTSFQDLTQSPSCGFRFRNYDPSQPEKVIMGPNWSFLEGIAGLGLVLLSWRYPVGSEWDRIFLVS